MTARWICLLAIFPTAFAAEIEDEFMTAEEVAADTFSKFGCFSSAECALHCGTTCISECCRDKSCLESSNPEEWQYPLRFGSGCYERCYNDCAYVWEDISSCPGKCMNKCEGECEEAGHSLREKTVSKKWGKKSEQSADFAPSPEAQQCYQQCYFQCAEEGKCISCEDSCDQECMQAGKATSLSPPVDGSQHSEQEEPTCRESTIYQECFDSCDARNECAKVSAEAVANGFEFDTQTGAVTQVYIPPLSAVEQCQEECDMDCQDECGQFDRDGKFLERVPGCYEGCFNECTLAGSCTDIELPRDGAPAGYEDEHYEDYVDTNATVFEDEDAGW